MICITTRKQLRRSAICIVHCHCISNHGRSCCCHVPPRALPAHVLWTDARCLYFPCCWASVLTTTVWQRLTLHCLLEQPMCWKMHCDVSLPSRSDVRRAEHPRSCLQSVGSLAFFQKKTSTCHIDLKVRLSDLLKFAVHNLYVSVQIKGSSLWQIFSAPRNRLVSTTELQHHISDTCPPTPKNLFHQSQPKRPGESPESCAQASQHVVFLIRPPLQDVCSSKTTFKVEVNREGPLVTLHGSAHIAGDLAYCLQCIPPKTAMKVRTSGASPPWQDAPIFFPAIQANNVLESCLPGIKTHYLA